MEIKPEHEARLTAALEYADEQFWAVIAARFREEAKTGDFLPDLTFSRAAHNREDVLWWLTFNAPQLLVGGVEEQPQALKPGVYESGYGNTISWDGQVAYDLDIGEEVPSNVILKDRFIRPLD